MASLRKIDKTLHKNNIYTFVQFILNENETKRIKKNLHKNNQRSTSTSIYIEMYRDSVVLSICCDFFLCCSIAQFFLCGRIKIQFKRAETASPHRNNNKKKKQIHSVWLVPPVTFQLVACMSALQMTHFANVITIKIRVPKQNKKVWPTEKAENGKICHLNIVRR